MARAKAPSCLNSAVQKANESENDVFRLREFSQSLLPEFPISSGVLNKKADLLVTNVSTMNGDVQFGTVFEDIGDGFTAVAGALSDAVDAIRSIPGIKQVAEQLEDFSRTSVGKAFFIAMGPIGLTTLFANLPGIGMQFAYILNSTGPVGTLLQYSLPGLVRGESVDVALINGGKLLIQKLGSVAGTQVPMALAKVTEILKGYGIDPQMVIDKTDEFRKQANLTLSTEDLPPDLQRQLDDWKRPIIESIDVRKIAAEIGVPAEIVQYAIDGIMRMIPDLSRQYDSNGNLLTAQQVSEGQVDFNLSDNQVANPAWGAAHATGKTPVQLKKEWPHADLTQLIRRAHWLFLTGKRANDVYPEGYDSSMRGQNLSESDQRAANLLDSWLRDKVGGKTVTRSEMRPAATFPFLPERTEIKEEHVGGTYRSMSEVESLARSMARGESVLGPTALVRGLARQADMARVDAGLVLTRLHDLAMLGQRTDETPAKFVDPTGGLYAQAVGGDSSATIRNKMNGLQATMSTLPAGSPAWAQAQIALSKFASELPAAIKREEEQRKAIEADRAFLEDEPTTVQGLRERGDALMNIAIIKDSIPQEASRIEAAKLRARAASYFARAEAMVGGSAVSAMAKVLPPEPPPSVWISKGSGGYNGNGLEDDDEGEFV